MSQLSEYIDNVPWNKLAHAYNGAWDVPEHLHTILSPTSTDDLAHAIDWFWGAVLHQGSVYSASIPSVWILVELIKIQPNHPAVASVLSFIGTIAELDWNVDDSIIEVKPVTINTTPVPYAVFVENTLPKEFEDDEDAYFNACQLLPSQVKQLCIHAIPVVAHYITSTDADIQREMVFAGLNLLTLLPDEAKPLKAIFEIVGNSDYDPSIWVNIGMKHESEDVVNTWINSDDERLQLIGALNPLSKDHPNSLNILTQHLPQIESNSHHFPNFVGHLHYWILDEIVKRTDANTAPPCVVASMIALIKKRAPIKSNSSWTFSSLSDAEVIPILHWAFKERIAEPPYTKELFAPLPTSLTATQYAILDVLYSEKDIWNPTNGNMSLAYASVHLPYNRKEIKTLLNR